MTTPARAVGRPEPDEVPPHFVGYLKRVPEPDPVTACAAQIEDTAALLHGISAADAMYRYAPDKWSIKEVVGHLADVERIMAYRALRIARGDTTPLPGFDENTYVPAGKFDTRSLADLVGTSAPREPRLSRCCAASTPTPGAAAAPRAASP